MKTTINTINKNNNDDFLFLIEQGIKAPSGHNTQPWLFKLNNNVIEIHSNYKRALPIVDFDNRYS